MKAVVINRFGGPEVFEISELPRPEARKGQVVIRVEASSVNPVDYKIRDGRARFLAPLPPTVLHPDAADTVASAGPRVENFRIGDRVMCFASGLMGKHGALAEYMAADARMVARIPNDVGFEDAAALPLVSVTSWYNIVEAAQARPGLSLLVMGGTGGVGHIAIQLAKWKGAFVAAACGSSEKCAQAKALGADAVINYRTAEADDYARLAPGEDGSDVVFNTPGLASVNEAAAAARFGGSLIDILGEFPTEGGFQMKWLSFKSTFAGHEIVFEKDPSRVGSILSQISRLVGEGVVRPLLDPRRFTFSEVGAAHDYAEHGQPLGKVVLAESATQGFNDQLSGFGAGEVLLPGHEIAISDGKALPGPGLNIVGAQLLELVLNGPRHNVRAFREHTRTHTAWSAKSSSTLANPVTVLPSTRGLPLLRRA